MDALHGWNPVLSLPAILARARRGLVSVPRPLRALRRSSQRLSRYAQITGIAVRGCPHRRPAAQPPGPGRAGRPGRVIVAILRDGLN